MEEVRKNKILWIGSLLGLVAFALGLKFSPERTWINFLLNNFYFLSLSLAAVLFISINNIAKAGWPTLIRRVPEAMSSYIPIGCLFMLGLYFGLHDLYHWSHTDAVHHDEILKAKSPYLNSSFFLIRIVVYSVIWAGLSSWISKNSRAQDESGDLSLTRLNKVLSSLFVVFFLVTFTFASVDWVMSIEPHWFSTIFPWYVIGGTFVNAVVVITLLVIYFHKKGFFPELTPSHLHDLGKYIFAFSVMWAYLWFSQYVLIWYSNIPEETTYYIARSVNGWFPLFILNLIINFVVPFFLLLSAQSKKKTKSLILTGVILLFGHWLDLYVMIAPALQTESPQIGLLEVVFFIGFASLFLILVLRTFNKNRPVPIKDPFLEESVHFHS